MFLLFNVVVIFVVIVFVHPPSPHSPSSDDAGTAGGDAYGAQLVMPAPPISASMTVLMQSAPDLDKTIEKLQRKIKERRRKDAFAIESGFISQ